MDFSTMVIMVVIAFTTILISLVVLSQMGLTATLLMESSVLSTSKDVVLGGIGQAKVYLALAVVICAIVMIAGIFMSIMKEED
jgi:hypothetical protein